MRLFPLAVVAPEISMGLALGQGAIALITVIWPWSGYGWLIVLGGSLGGIALSSIPLWQLGTTLHQAQTEMERGLGVGYGDPIPPALKKQMRPRPFMWLDLVCGIPVPQEQVRCDRHRLATPDGATLAMDLYRPVAATTGGEGLPILVTIHGGGWQSGQPEDTATFSRYMAAQGYGVAAIAYRHAPDHRFPTQLKDVQTHLRWLIRYGADYHLDPSRLALVGWSAGAHLALLATFQGDTPSIQAVVNYYSPVDLRQGYGDRPRPDPLNVPRVLETFLGGSPDDCPEQYRAASPLYSVRSGLPPTLSLYGDRDHLVKPIFGQQLHQRLQDYGNQSVLIRLPWAEHAFDRVWPGMGNQIALYYVERFLAHTLQI
ncbi:MAG: alpha/beta hydrolase [Leptolyngbyaceae bacterium]|nr:alpha/beta hydrolase [Leptolyngbyaceae bacterium]